jgi:hypothetical protein
MYIALLLYYVSTVRVHVRIVDLAYPFLHMDVSIS